MKLGKEEDIVTYSLHSSNEILVGEWDGFPRWHEQSDVRPHDINLKPGLLLLVNMAMVTVFELALPVATYICKSRGSEVFCRLSSTECRG